MNETNKPDVTLSDGVEVRFDKHNIKPREWRALFDPAQPDEDGQRTIAAFAGLPFEYVSELSLYDWQLLLRVAADVVRAPVLPNSLAGSTSPS